MKHVYEIDMRVYLNATVYVVSKGDEIVVESKSKTLSYKVMDMLNAADGMTNEQAVRYLEYGKDTGNKLERAHQMLERAYDWMVEKLQEGQSDDIYIVSDIHDFKKEMNGGK